MPHSAFKLVLRKVTALLPQARTKRELTTSHTTDCFLLTIYLPLTDYYLLIFTTYLLLSTFYYRRAPLTFYYLLSTDYYLLTLQARTKKEQHLEFCQALADVKDGRFSAESQAELVDLTLALTLTVPLTLPLPLPLTLTLT